MTTEQFNALPASEKRIVIANDVIANVKAKKYRALAGEWVSIHASELNGNEDIKSNFDKIDWCTVCALGACLMSTVKFKNTLTFDDVDEIDAYSSSWNLLADIFEPEQLFLIENCFEGNYELFHDRVSVKVFEFNPEHNIQNDLYEDYNNIFDTYEEQLILIMENIIRNQGTFIPEQDLTNNE